jgi:hypothetical protein
MDRLKPFSFAPPDRFQDLEAVVAAHHHRMNCALGKRDAGAMCSRFPSHS